MAKKQFGPAYTGDYPAEMRTQLWPLCCGARILSGFKDVGKLSEDELVEKINDIIDNYVPDHQVFSYEKMMPKLIWLTLNSSQMDSKKIMNAVKRCGFKLVLTAKPRGHSQGFFVKDESKTVKVEPLDLMA